MQLHKAKALHELGASRVGEAWTCPVHKGADGTLTYTERGGQDYFVCGHPNCMFRGNALELVAAVRGLRRDDALKAFQSGDCAAWLAKPLSIVDVCHYSNNESSESARLYLSRCCGDARKTPELLRLRAGLTTQTLSALPPMTGKLRYDDPPKAVRNFISKAHRAQVHTIFGYTHEGRLTHVDLMTSGSPVIETVAIDGAEPVGVYPEHLGPVTDKTLFVTFNARLAALVYGNCVAEAVDVPPVVSVRKLRLPSSYLGVSKVVILNARGSELPLHEAFTLLGADIIPGRPVPPTVHVCTRDALDTLGYGDLVRIGAGSGTVSLPEWVLGQLDELLLASEDTVRATLGTICYSDKVRSMLTQAAARGSHAPRLVELLSETPARVTDTLNLGNDRQLLVDSTGIRGVAMLKIVPLANFKLQVEHKLVTASGALATVCTVGGPGYPCDVTVTLEDSALAPAYVKTQIERAYIAKGHTPYVAAYATPDFLWTDIIGRLASGRPVYTELPVLGAAPDGSVNLPALVFKPDTAPEPQRHLYTLSADLGAMYGGMDAREPADPAVLWRKLLGKCDNIYVAGLVLGLLHWCGTVAYTARLRKARRAGSVKHLLYVDSTHRVWRKVLLKLAGVFGDPENPSIATAIRNPAHFKPYAQLGTLPLFCSLPTLRGVTAPQLLEAAPIPLIAEVDSDMAEEVADNGTSFFVASAHGAGDADELESITEDDLRALLYNWLPTVLGADEAGRKNDMTALALYKGLCSTLSIEPSETVEHMVASTYYGNTLPGAQLLFGALHKVVNHYVDVPYFNMLYAESPGSAATGHHIVVASDRVYIHKSTLTPLNQCKGLRVTFNERALDADLRKRGLLCERSNRDPERYWEVPRAVWDTHVIARALRLEQAAETEREEAHG